MAARHTPGPWWVDSEYSGDIQAAGTEVASTWKAGQAGCHVELVGPMTVPHAEMEANARLIAAAPDLLAALIRLEKRCGPNAVDGNQARAAIAKATGQ